MMHQTLLQPWKFTVSQILVISILSDLLPVIRYVTNYCFSEITADDLSVVLGENATISCVVTGISSDVTIVFNNGTDDLSTDAGVYTVDSGTFQSINQSKLPRWVVALSRNLIYVSCYNIKIWVKYHVACMHIFTEYNIISRFYFSLNNRQATSRGRVCDMICAGRMRVECGCRIV